MLNYNPEVEWMDEQKFTADGLPIPFSEQLITTEAVPKMMDSIHAANDIGQELKSAWFEGAKDFFSGGGMLNSKKDTSGRNKAVKRVPSLKTSEKPGWKLPTDAEGNINGNYWSVNENDPYWQTPEGYTEAVNLYGFKPGWIKEPVEDENIVNFQPTKRISL